jgi:hypothetical protein
MYRGSVQKLDDFSGGWCSNLATTTHTLHQAADLDNIIVLGRGKGWRKRNGNSAFNSTAMNSGATVQGGGYFKTAADAEYLVAVAGNKLYKSDSLDGVMDEITGSLTITAGNNNVWTLVPFNDVIVGFGGPPTNPNAPFVYNGTGNASALTGTPPSAYGAFQSNNKLFAYRTQANPSFIYWTAAGTHSNWTGTGSGNTSIWKNDNDKISAHAVLDNNTVLLFKENSVHQMITTNLISGAYPTFPLFTDTGCIGKGAVVVLRGLVYFITPTGRMRITDGHRILTETDVPNLRMIDDQWSALNTSRYPYIQGSVYEGADFEHIVWEVTSSGGTTHDKAFIWDVRHGCWLKNSTGFNMNCLIKTQSGVMYGGGYDGKLYKIDASSTTVTDASNSSAPINGFWLSGWLSENNFENIKQVRQTTVSFKTQDGGNFEFAYGYDFNAFQATFPISQQAPGAQWDVDLFDDAEWGVQSDLLRPGNRILGRGNVFQFRIRSQVAFNTKINALTFSGKQYGQKLITAR